MTNTADLDSFDFLQLLRMLADGGKTGALHIIRDRENFHCWLEDGRVRHLQLGHIEGIGALVTLMQESRGRFQFDEGQRHHDPQLDTTLDEAVLAASAQLPLLAVPFEGPARLTSAERVAALDWTADEQKLLRRIESQVPLAEVAAEPGGRLLISQLLRLGLLKPRKSRVARLMVGVAREVRGVVLVDDHIFRRWKDDLGRPFRQLAVRDEAGQTYTFPVREGAGLGTQLLVSADLIMQTSLRAGDSVLAKPV
ncbi:DUF4388 domain-containing protein [Deinococcus sp.]|uniref:DUF4388 domain-containing protein n=1 Tax=Deinococcus sp. TaxID=47478 RepID=UPI0025C3633B|nr:DUF4388 domain-containing protein [Deinococcus sp.]